MSANELDPRAYIPGSLREDKPRTEGQPIHALPMPPYDFQGNTTPTDNLEAGAGDLVAELLGFHDCMDNGGAGDGRFYIQLATGLDSEQTRLNFRAVLREAAAQLAAVTAERDEALALVNYAEDISKQITAENARLREALERIEAWEMPATGKFWENADGTPSDRPMQYSACYGSNGERDYVRARARAALSQEAPK